MSEKTIQFMANYDDWTSIKKLKIDESTDPKTIMEFLTSLGYGIDSKIESNMGKIIALDKLNAAINEVNAGKGEQEIAEALKEIGSRKVGAVIKEITALDGLQKNEIKELDQFCRVYAQKKILKKCGLMIDYSEVEIPGMKRLKKNK
ncbi:MAG: DUF2666 family protein [Candidatus Diapherotrites archaeon]